MRQKIWNLAAFASSQRNILSERLGSSGAFLIFDRIISKLFDYGLYPLMFLLFDRAVGGYLGFTLAGIVMTLLSLLTCWAWVYLYDHFEVDLLILEDVRRLRNNGSHKKGLKGWIARLLKKANFLSFVVVSFWYDPFFTSIFMREDEETKGVKGRRAWAIFIGSVFISNVYWWFPSFLIGTEGFFLAWSCIENWDFSLLKNIALVTIQYFGVYLILWHWLILVTRKRTT